MGALLEMTNHVLTCNSHGLHVPTIPWTKCTDNILEPTIEDMLDVLAANVVGVNWCICPVVRDPDVHCGLRDCSEETVPRRLFRGDKPLWTVPRRQAIIYWEHHS